MIAGSLLVIALALVLDLMLLLLQRLTAPRGSARRDRAVEGCGLRDGARTKTQGPSAQVEYVR